MTLERKSWGIYEISLQLPAGIKTYGTDILQSIFQQNCVGFNCQSLSLHHLCICAHIKLDKEWLAQHHKSQIHCMSVSLIWLIVNLFGNMHH